MLPKRYIYIYRIPSCIHMLIYRSHGKYSNTFWKRAIMNFGDTAIEIQVTTSQTLVVQQCEKHFAGVIVGKVPQHHLHHKSVQLWVKTRTVRLVFFFQTVTWSFIYWDTVGVSAFPSNMLFLVIYLWNTLFFLVLWPALYTHYPTVDAWFEWNSIEQCAFVSVLSVLGA